jgi:aubergine-like protein
MQQVGRYYYDPTRPAQIPQHKLELWPGYITAITYYQGLYTELLIKTNFIYTG